MDPEGAYALVIGKFLKQRKEGKPLTICGDGQYQRDYTHVDDAVEANISAMTSTAVGKGEMINIGNGEPHSVNELAKMIGRAPVISGTLAPTTSKQKNCLAGNQRLSC